MAALLADLVVVLHVAYLGYVVLGGFLGLCDVRWLLPHLVTVVWGVLQVGTGMLSDRIGRKGLIAWGMVVQAGGIWLTVAVPEYGAWLLGAVLQGAGTAMVYPTLLAAITDHAHPSWRASSLGVYRFWRDLGYAIGALLSGIIADTMSVGAAIHFVAALTLASGLVTFGVMRAPRSAAMRDKATLQQSERSTR